MYIKLCLNISPKTFLCYQRQTFTEIKISGLKGTVATSKYICHRRHVLISSPAKFQEQLPFDLVFIYVFIDNKMID